jgi:Tfp pilus assembly protein PilF
MYEASLKIGKELDYKECIADSYTNLGSIHIKLKNCSQSEKYLKKSLELSQQLEKNT